ncbi:MAG: hypothetical protein KC656_05150 [Myxococcales bacterium]|nr:hypothetical protein [Myxococcales bacterium]MCB9672950.1 hypothetical protein [Alphaproteobacteria bacterium]
MGRIGELIQGLEQIVPPWVLLAAAVVLAVLAAPGWVEGLRVKRVKARIRRMTRAEAGERERLLAEVWALADGRPEVLLALAREADKMNLPALRDRAIRDLEARGTHKDALRRLEGPPKPGEHRFAHPVEACVSIERLLENGADEAARARLAEALQRFPRDEGLLALRQRLEGSQAV